MLTYPPPLRHLRPRNTVFVKSPCVVNRARHTCLRVLTAALTTLATTRYPVCDDRDFSTHSVTVANMPRSRLQDLFRANYDHATITSPRPLRPLDPLETITTLRLS